MNNTNYTPSQLEKIQSLCFNNAKRFKKVRYYDKQFELFVGKDGVIYARFMHWTNDKNGFGIKFAFENNGNVLKSSDWKFISVEEAQHPQIYSFMNTMSNIGSDYTRILGIY